MSKASRAELHPLISERQWREAIVNFAEWNGWKVYWTWNSQHSPAGFPDLVLVRGDRCIFAELKAERGQVAAKQREWADVLSCCSSVEYYLWRPSDEDLVWELLK